MKPILTSLILLFVLTLVNAQENIIDKDVYYETKKGITFYVLDLASDSFKEVEKKQTPFALKFILPNTLVVGKKYSEVNFTWEEFDNPDIDSLSISALNGQGLVKLKGSDDYINSEDKNKRFFILTTELSTYIDDGNIEQQFKKWKGKLVTGATISTPFKFRPKRNGKNYIFSPELSLGPYVGLNYRLDRKNPIFLNFVLSAGFNTININDNVQIEKDSKDGLAFGFYSSVGTVLQLNDFQVGLLYGYDFVSGEMGKNWMYNEKPWFSFSIGYNFLSTSSKAERQAKKQTQEINTNNQQVLQELLNNPNVDRVIQNKDGSWTAYKKAEQITEKVPTNTASSDDQPVKDIKTLNAAKTVEQFSSKNEKWVYFGELNNGTYSGPFGNNLKPEKGNEFTALTSVFKRDRYPLELENKTWEKGKIIGAVDEDEKVTVYDMKPTSNGKQLWIRIQ